MREVIVDTETTGLEHTGGDRIIEIGMVEHVDGFRTENEFCKYVNPQRPVGAESTEVHGIESEFLKDKPLFAEIADEFLVFAGNDRLVIHNAEFDLAFLNMELKKAGRKEIDSERVFDTLGFAREVLPSRASHSLDSLCNYYKIDKSRRSRHGALLDARLLSDVYLALLRDNDKGDMIDMLAESQRRKVSEFATPSSRPNALEPRLDEAALSRHKQYVVNKLGSNSLWTKFIEE